MPGNEARWRRKTNKVWFREAQQIAADKSFFHWELEFPDVFVGAGKVKENPGWDCVIGNPPWGADFDEGSKNYIRINYSSGLGETESNIIFTEKGSILINSNGFLGYITPNTWLSQKRGEKLRKYLVENCSFREIVHLSKYIFKDVPDIVPIVFILTKGQKFDVVTVKILKNGLKSIRLINDDYSLINHINYAKWRSTNIFNIYLSQNVDNLLNKIKSGAEETSKNFEVVYGIKTGNNERYLSDRKLKENFVPCLEKGAEIRRYQTDWFGKYLDYGPHLEGYKSHNVEIPKIVIQYTRKLSMKRRIVATFDLEGKYYPLNRFSYIYSKSDIIELFYLMAILSSKTVNYYHANTFVDYDIKPTYLQKHPIRRINFTTPPEERTALIESLKSIYNANEFDKIIQLVEECLPKDIEGNFITEKEKSDAVHDLLAFLAERMIEMNKDKNEEIKGFLEWFEREIGAKIETLTNRTKLKQYYDFLDFDELLDILKKNKKKIPANLSNRELQKNLKEEFEGSMRKLRPLIERIEKTDELIDQVVYRLYGLSEEEIRVVEDAT